MKKYGIIFALLILIPSLALTAQSYDWYPDDFLGEWELQLLFEIDPDVANSEDVPDRTWFDTITVSFFDDGTGTMTSTEGDQISVTWEADDTLLTIAFPDAGDFQYVATYQYAAQDFGLLIVAMYDLFDPPRVGIMKRLSMWF